MTSCDTNILVYAYNEMAPEHGAAFRFLASHLQDDRFALSELVLIEFYVLIRNPAIFPDPASASRAVSVIQELRSNPFWTILKGTVDVSDPMWAAAASRSFPRRGIFDARLAYSLAAEGVTRFATRNVSDFEGFGVFEVFDPLR